MHNQKEPKPIINANVLGFKRYGSFHLRNIIEGVFCSSIIYWIIEQIPFVPKVKIIVTICLIAAVMLVNIKGFKNQSLSEVLINMMLEKKNDKDYHMRCINDEEIKSQEYSETAGEKSIADRIAIWTKEVYRHYKKTGEIKFR